MPIGRVRPAVDALPSYRPGKAAGQAEKEHGITNAIKLASNENPYPPVDAVLEAVADAARGVNRYNDHRSTALRSAIADWVGVPLDQIAVGGGSVGILQQLCVAYLEPDDEVLTPWLSFEAYPIITQMMAATMVKVPLVDHAFDLDAVANAVTDRTKIIMLATPNNPTGTALAVAQIRSLVNQVRDDVIVVVDEAYREFSDPLLGDPVTDLLPHHPNVIVTRTFSKAYGLAGLRVGYAMAHPELISTADKTLLAFTVNSAAQAGALAAIGALDAVQERIDTVRAERDRTVKALGDAGWTLPPALGNFVYLPIGDDTDRIYLAMEKEGVVTRPFSGEGIRATIGLPEENDRFIATLAAASS